MQLNELVAQVQQATRLPDMDMDRPLDESRRTGTKLSETIGRDPDGRKVVAGTTRMPRRYGAGF